MSSSGVSQEKHIRLSNRVSEFKQKKMELENRVNELEQDMVNLKEIITILEVNDLIEIDHQMVVYWNHLWNNTFTDNQSKSLGNLRRWFLRVVGLKYGAFERYTTDLKLVVHRGNVVFKGQDDYKGCEYDHLVTYSEKLTEIGCYDLSNNNLFHDVIYYIRDHCNLKSIDPEYLTVGFNL